ncbi:nucleotide-binding alpha-beta plait domain-containing protein [Tanacetum coccineum]
MGDRRSKEDYVHQLSISIYVTNFPNHFSYRDLWRACDDYGKVVDVFIPNKRSKAGNRYGFVRYIMVDDIDKLVNNLCTIWFGRMRLHANVVRFQRAPLNKRPEGANGGYNKRSEDMHKDLGNRMKTNSYAGVLKQSHVQPESIVESKPALVLDNSCMLQREFPMSLMGKVKEFSSLSNLPVEKFQNHIGVGSWFATLQQASKMFQIDERVTWVDIEGIPLQAWTENTFARIASKWGELIYTEDNDESCLHRKLSGWVPEFIEEEEALNESDDEMSNEDLNMMNEELKKKTNLDVQSDEEEEVQESSFVQEYNHANDAEHGQNSNEEEGEIELNRSNDKEGCEKGDMQKESSIPDDYMQMPTPETKMEKISLFNIKALWGNSLFDYAVSSSVGQSGGLLCVWDPSMFKKDNVTISDSFVAIRGTCFQQVHYGRRFGGRPVRRI